MKPAAWSKDRAESFLDEDAVHAYRHRAPYPDEVFSILAGLITETPRVVLDVGCGSGAVARYLTPLVDRVDAVDPSAAMIAAGRKLPGGDHPRLRWIADRAEDAPLQPPYAQIVAGMSLHWLDWEVALPRFARILTPHGFLVVLYNSFGEVPWKEELRALRHEVRNYDYPRPLEAVDELEKDGLFQRCGAKETTPIAFRQTVADYVEQHHSRSDMARVKIGVEGADRFDAELRRILAKYVHGDEIALETTARVVWGKPLCL